MTEIWPSLPWPEWHDTCATVHRWTQIVGKIRLALAPPVNHWWQVPLYVGVRGLTTAPMPYGSRMVQIDFDFMDHRLVITTSDGAPESFALGPGSVADFYATLMGRLRALELDLRIWPVPVEMANPVPFDRDTDARPYQPEAVHRFWRILRQAHRVLTLFRGRFLGKASPVHFFWGSFDLATSRFSGRLAPPHPSVPNTPDAVTREAYSHEVSSCGFWPGGPGMEQPVFYAYAYPEPPAFAEKRIRPGAAFYSRPFGEFLLPYDTLRRSASPDDDLLAFLQDSYAAAADLGGWDRPGLERAEPYLGAASSGVLVTSDKA